MKRRRSSSSCSWVSKGGQDNSVVCDGDENDVASDLKDVSKKNASSEQPTCFPCTNSTTMEDTKSTTITRKVSTCTILSSTSSSSIILSDDSEQHDCNSNNEESNVGLDLRVSQVHEEEKKEDKTSDQEGCHLKTQERSNFAMSSSKNLIPPASVLSSSASSFSSSLSLSQECRRTEVEEGRVSLVFESSIDHVCKRRHPEQPQRISVIYDALHKAGLLSQCRILDTNRDEDGASKPQTILSHEDYYSVHQRGYMKRLEGYSKIIPKTTKREKHANDSHRQNWLDEEASQYNSIYLTAKSAIEAKQAVSALCSLVKHTTTRPPRRRQQQEQQCLPPLTPSCGFAIIRPPGHHAESSMANGFCLLNNIAIAANYARRHLKKERVLIVDWDIHHGQGTQQTFENDSEVLYFSIHGKYLFPYNAPNSSTTNNSGPQFVGSGSNGKGYNINIAWTDSTVIGDDEYYAAWQHLLLPIIREYQPDLILISAGFDAAEGDIGGCHVSSECYGNLTKLMLQEVHQLSATNTSCQVVAALEGGYLPSTLGECIVSVIQAMVSSSLLSSSSKPVTLESLPLTDIHPVAARNLQATIQAHKPYWKYL